MDAHDAARHSSLPSSLIPHLYRHPSSGTRTTLAYHDPPPPPPPRPPYTFPPPPPPALPPRTAWSEGEAGPSSLLHYPPPPRDPRSRRAAASLSPRLAPHPDPFARPYDPDAAFPDFARREPDRDPYLLLPGPPIHNDHHSYYPQPHSSYHTTDLVLPPDLDDDHSSGSHFSFSSSRHDPYPPYLSVANLSLHTPPPTHFRSPGSAEGGGASYAYRSDSYPDNLTSNDDEAHDHDYHDHPHRSNKRRADSLQDSSDPRKQSTPRKTAVACNFCRGRKLRCNGARPACSHCTARKITCEYVSTPKRRGPGKAPKGTRAKKAGGVLASRPDPSSSSSNNNITIINATPNRTSGTADRPSSAVLQLPAYELAAQAPEMRPYTHVMALDTLDIFSFQPPAEAPRYPTGRGDTPTEMMRREYYERTRGSPRRRETSSEDWSGAERIE